MSHCSMSNLHIGSIETLHGFSPQRQVNGVNVNMVEHNNHQVIAELSNEGDKVVVVLKIGSDTMAASIERLHNSNGGIIWVGAQKFLWGGLPQMEVVKDGSERPEPHRGFHYVALIRLEFPPLARGKQDKKHFDVTVSNEGTNTSDPRMGLCGMLNLPIKWIKELKGKHVLILFVMVLVLLFLVSMVVFSERGYK